jgi:hypothetical protein
MPMGGCGGAHIGSLCISIIILVIVIILIVMVVYNYNSTNNTTTTTTTQRPQINNRAALAAAGIYRRNNGGTGGSGFRNKNRRKNGMTNGVSGNCNTGPCIASANCNNSSVACFYANGQLSTALKNVELANNGYIPMSIVNSLKNIRTTGGRGLSAKAMQTSHWPPMNA